MEALLRQTEQQKILLHDMLRNMPAACNAHTAIPARSRATSDGKKILHDPPLTVDTSKHSLNTEIAATIVSNKENENRERWTWIELVDIRITYNTFCYRPRINGRDSCKKTRNLNVRLSSCESPKLLRRRRVTLSPRAWRPTCAAIAYPMTSLPRRVETLMSTLLHPPLPIETCT